MITKQTHYKTKQNKQNHYSEELDLTRLRVYESSDI